MDKGLTKDGHWTDRRDCRNSDVDDIKRFRVLLPGTQRAAVAFDLFWQIKD